MHPDIQAAIRAAADSLGLSHTGIVSGPGHDAQSFADCCPAGIIFLPSKDGASHSPREHTAWQHCVDGANALLQTALRAAAG